MNLFSSHYAGEVTTEGSGQYWLITINEDDTISWSFRGCYEINSNCPGINVHKTTKTLEKDKWTHLAFVRSSTAHANQDHDGGYSLDNCIYINGVKELSFGGYVSNSSQANDPPHGLYNYSGHNLDVNTGFDIGSNLWWNENYGFAYKPEMDELIEDRRKYRSPNLGVDFVKLWLDGDPVEPHSILVELQPKSNLPEYTKAFMDQETLNEAVKRFDQQGIQVKMHASGPERLVWSWMP